MRKLPTQHWRGVLAAGAVLALAVSYWSPPLRALLPLGPELQSLALDPRIRFEVGAEPHARSTASALASAIRRVEAVHGRPFREPPTVVVCAKQRSFNRRTGRPRTGTATGAAFFGRVYLSPGCFGRGEHEAVLAHELSHLHLRRHLGVRQYVLGLPGWFQEGLAVYVGGGGGVAEVTRADAVRWIRRGRGLRPSGSAPWRAPRGPREHGLPSGQYYRQAGMFVEWLAETEADAFERALERLYHGEEFGAAFGELPQSIEEMWAIFVRRL